MEKPLISIIITNYNYGEFISDAINSCFNQTYPNLEILIIDDGSTDKSEKIIKGFADTHKIKYIKQKNQGVVFARNKGLSKAIGEFIVFLDADDKLPEDYVQKLYERQIETSADIVYTDMQKFGEDDSFLELPEFNSEIIKSRNIVGMNALIKRSAIKNIKFDKNLNKLSHEDWDFYLNLMFAGAKFAKSKNTVLLYRIHGKSRNTMSEDKLRHDSLRFMKMYVYIVDKYRKKYPGQMEFSLNSEIVDWHVAASERLKIMDERLEIINDQRKYIAELEGTLDSISNSRAYKTAVSVMNAAKLKGLRKK